MERSTRIVCTYSDLFLPISCTSLVCKLCLLFQTILDLWAKLMLKVFSYKILRRIIFNSQLLFELLCSGIQIVQIRSVYHTIFWTQSMFYLKVFNIMLLVFSIYKLKSNHHLAIFPDLEMMQFWSVNLYVPCVNILLSFYISRSLGNIYMSVLVISESVLLLAFVIYMLQLLHSKLYFVYFIEAKNPCLVTKNCSKFSYICVFILSIKQYN